MFLFDLFLTTWKLIVVLSLTKPYFIQLVPHHREGDTKSSKVCHVVWSEGRESDRLQHASSLPHRPSQTISLTAEESVLSCRLQAYKEYTTFSQVLASSYLENHMLSIRCKGNASVVMLLILHVCTVVIMYITFNCWIHCVLFLDGVLNMKTTLSKNTPRSWRATTPTSLLVKEGWSSLPNTLG